MKRYSILIVFCCFLSSYCQGDGLWTKVNNRFNVADYEGMKNILDTATLHSNRDVVLRNFWMGQYYYWKSYEDRTKGELAENLFTKAIEIFNDSNISDKKLGYSYLHLAELKYLYGQYDEAIASLESALRVLPFKGRKRDLEDPSPVYKGLGACYAMKGDYRKALTYIDSCKQVYSGALSVGRMRGKVLAMKGDRKESLKYYSQFVDNIRKEVIDSFISIKSAKDRESWWMSIRPFITDCWRLESTAPDLLYDVALMTKGILLNQDSLSLTYTSSDIHKALPEGSVAIEWMVYETGGTRYLGAVVMRADGSMRFVRTGRVDDFNRWSALEDEIYENDSCSKTIWSRQMVKAIGKANNIYFAPDGILNQMGIEYIFPDTGVQLYRLTSTRELLKSHVHDYPTAAIFGGIDYNLANSNTATDRRNDEAAYNHAKTKNLKFCNLKQSAYECRSIDSIRHTEADTLVYGSAASEDNFRQMAGDYNMLFISTHGYCRTTARFESSDFPWKDKIDHSLSESGLVFCGFNAEQAARSGTGYTDGIVSARELCEMDMHNVGLCVVSACEGALGRASADGTYGIQRGLKSAGVDAMVLSLWEVDDNATRLFMTYLYSILAEGKNVHRAFWEARRMLRQHKESLTSPRPFTPYNKPRYYNAFILVDAI